MLTSSVMAYSYDRRASQPMSPWLMRLFDKIAQAHKAKIDDRAKSAGGDLSSAEELVRRHPHASDGELEKLALANFEFDWAEILEGHAAWEIITKWVDYVVTRTGAVGGNDADVTVNGNVLKVRTTAWGTTYEYSDDDPWARVEVPALDDMHNGAIAAKFRQTGATAHSEWTFVDDPNGYQADALTFPTTIEGHFDEKTLSQKYGAAAFEHAFKAVLPAARREVEENPTTHAPVAPPRGRGRRR